MNKNNTYNFLISSSLNPVIFTIGFKLVFNPNDKTKRKECNLLDGDHVARELEHLGYSQSFINVVLTML